MRSRNTLVPASGRQLDLIFKTRTLDGLSDKDRKKAISTLACLLMQAAGLAVPDIWPSERVLLQPLVGHHQTAAIPIDQLQPVGLA
nr:hypothetical protein [Rhizobium rhizogenes]